MFVSVGVAPCTTTGVHEVSDPFDGATSADHDAPLYTSTLSVVVNTESIPLTGEEIADVRAAASVNGETT